MSGVGSFWYLVGFCGDVRGWAEVCRIGKDGGLERTKVLVFNCDGEGVRLSIVSQQERQIECFNLESGCL